MGQSGYRGEGFSQLARKRYWREAFNTQQGKEQEKDQEGEEEENEENEEVEEVEEEPQPIKEKRTYKIKAPRGKGYVFVDSKPRPWDGALDESSESKHCAKRARRMMVDENGEAEYEEEEWDDDDDELWS